MNTKLMSATAMIALSLGAGALAALNPMVGGAPMYHTKNIIQNAVTSKDHTNLVAAVKAAGLVPTLEGAGLFTVFAPTNEALAVLPAATVEKLVKPESKGQLTQILTYHVVPGRYDAMYLDHAIKTTAGGRVSFKTAEGELLIAAEIGNALTITDQKGDTARVTIPDVYRRNGVLMVIEKVLMP